MEHGSNTDWLTSGFAVYLQSIRIFPGETSSLVSGVPIGKRKKSMASRRKKAERDHSARKRKAVRPRESLGEQLLREADEQHDDFAKSFRQFLKGLGIKGKPIGAKKLREKLL